MVNMAKWLQDWKSARAKKSMPILSFPAIAQLGITVKDLIASPDAQARGMKAIADRCPTAASVGMMDLSVEAEAFGSVIKVSEDEVPTVIGRLLESEEDVDNLRVPPPTSGRTGLYIQAIRQALGLITDRPVFAGAIGPFSLAGRLMDVTEIMVNCLTEPEMVHKTLEKVSEFTTSYILEYKKIGAHGVVMAEPAAGLLSPDLNAEFSARYVKRIRDAVRDDHFLFIYHNCGKTLPLVQSLMSIQADGYHFGNAIDLEDMLKIVPEDVLVMGNIDPSSHFRLGTPEKMRRAVLDLLARCGKYPNFCISSGCDIPPLSPWTNIDAFFAAIAEHYGV